MSELKLFNRVYEDLKRRRQKILDGKINCIPCSFNRFSEEWPGVEQSKYFLITAQQKVKSIYNLNTYMQLLRM